MKLAASNLCWAAADDEAAWGKMKELGYTGLDDALLKKYIADSRALWEGHEDALHCVQVGSVIGVHGGPGAVVCAYFAAG